MEKNVQTIPNIDPRISPAEANTNGLAVAKELTKEETSSDPTFFVRTEAASHSQFDR
jgi:hypothetical protein